MRKPLDKAPSISINARAMLIITFTRFISVFLYKKGIMEFTAILKTEKNIVAKTFNARKTSKFDCASGVKNKPVAAASQNLLTIKTFLRSKWSMIYPEIGINKRVGIKEVSTTSVSAMLAMFLSTISLAIMNIDMRYN